MTPGLRTLDRSRAVRNIGSALGRGLLLVLVVIVLQATRQAQAEDNTRQTVLHGAWLVEGDGLLWLWGPLCAAISGAGGGILRDILRVGYNNPALRTSFYAEVCLCWGLLLSLAILYLLTEEDPALLRISIVITVLGALGTRLLLVAFKVRSPRF